MKKIILASACAVIIVLVSFTSVVSAQATESTSTSILQRIRERIEDINWEPGNFLMDIIGFIFYFILFLLFAGFEGFPSIPD